MKLAGAAVLFPLLFALLLGGCSIPIARCALLDAANSHCD
jgi:hypothetical protein